MMDGWVKHRTFTPETGAVDQKSVQTYYFQTSFAYYFTLNNNIYMISFAVWFSLGKD